MVRRGPSGRPYDFMLVITDFGHTHTKAMQQDEMDATGIDSHGGQTYGKTMAVPCAFLKSSSIVVNNEIGAPECSHHASFTHHGRNRINTEADIFSMGCVMSDGAAFVAGGQSMRAAYKENRINETKRLKAFFGSGSEGCFHNGIEALEAVGYMHQRISDTARDNFDSVTPCIVEVVQMHMLLRAGDGRWTAKELWDRFTEITTAVNSPSPIPSLRVLKQPQRPPSQQQRYPRQLFSQQPAQRQTLQPQQIRAYPQSLRPMSTGNIEPMAELASPIESSLLTRSPPHSPPTHSPRLGGDPLGIDPPTSKFFACSPETNGRQINMRHIPKLSLLDLRQHRTQTKSKYNMPVDKSVHETILQLQSNLKDRDHIFFIDTSKTMFQYMAQIHEVFTEVGYVAKGIDTNGIEVFFTTDPQKPYTGSTTALLQKFYDQKWDQFTFEAKFAAFIDKRVLPTLGSWRSKIRLSTTKKLSVYVFTDGEWGNEDNGQGAGGVENPIKKLIDKMNRKGVSRTQIMIQFIQFGASDIGTRNLNFLDTLGVEYNW